VPKGCSQLGLDLPRVSVPVLDHRWRLLLPEGARYRFHDSELRPAPASEVVSVIRAAVMTPKPAPPAAGPGLGGQSRITGRVTNDQGGPLPGATVTINNHELQLERTATTGADGSFFFALLPLGPYTVTITADGHQPEVYSLKLGAAETRPVNVQLAPGEVVAEQITVTGVATALETTTTGMTFDVGAERRSSGGRREPSERVRQELLEKQAQSRLYFHEIDQLKHGLVGGVRPLPVTIPESGKALLLTGVLPPGRVAAELEVKAKR
jgi:hypothetical protein